MIPNSERVLRDLKWVLASPPMLDHRAMVDSEALALDLARFQGTLARLGRPGSVLEQVATKSPGQKLGAYFEGLLFTWLGEIGPARLIAHNLQVAGARGTVGEFDVVFTRDGLAHHWEAAVKFYLGHPGPRGEPYWYGPNPTDRLDTKWARMLGRQLRLSQTPEGRAALEQLGLGEVEARALVRGRLFEAVDSRYRVGAHPDVHSDVLKGFWGFSGQVGLVEEVYPGLRWRVLPRLWWLSAIEAEDVWPEVELRSLVGTARPVHVVGVDFSGQEVVRGFIVPPSWPGA